jgi:hypothetical protein
VTCTACGARYKAADDSCASRFDFLLALDHGRTEPWGSRHGLAFSVFALQHAARHPASLDVAWRMLCRVYLHRVEHTLMAAELRSAISSPASAPPIPPRTTPLAPAPSVTIADLGDFAAEHYAERLDAWCRATLEWYGQTV